MMLGEEDAMLSRMGFLGNFLLNYASEVMEIQERERCDNSQRVPSVENYKIEKQPTPLPYIMYHNIKWIL